MSIKKNTSFRQYVECGVCRLHHNYGSKHLYTKQHKGNLKIVFKKSMSKISESRRYMDHPEIHDEDWESDKTFWCYFCSQECLKHGHSNKLTVNGLGMINHFADHSHFENVKKYLKANRVNDAAEKFILKKTDLLSFLPLVPVAEAKYLKKMEIIHQSHVAAISKSKNQRMSLLNQVSCETTLAQASQVNVSSDINNGQQINSNGHVPARKYTKPGGSVKVPPWLLPADASTCIVTRPSIVVESPVIGPSIADLEKHIEKQRKKGLNPKRVGANFNHGASTSATWLPSFGRVWNQGRRKQSQIQFQNQSRKRNSKRELIPPR